MNPGASLDAADLLDSLRAEVEILGIEIESWSAQLLIDGAAPARGAELSGVAGFYRIDPVAVYWSPAEEQHGEIGSWSAQRSGG